MTIIKHLIILTALFFICSCERSTVLTDFQPHNSEEGIAILGGISSDKKGIIKISQVGASAGDINFNELALQDPAVMLLKNGEEEIFLIEEEKREFKLATPEKITVGDEFQLTVTADNLPKAISEKITIPPLPKVRNLDYFDSGEVTINNLPIWKLNFDLDFDPQIDYYSVSIAGIDPLNQSRIGGFESWFTSQNAELCSFDQGGIYNLYFDASCMNEKTLNIDLNTQLSEFISFGNGILDSITHVKISIAAIDENLYEFLKTTNIRSEETFLGEYFITYSNIRNGYGVFYGYNQLDTIFVVR